MYQHGLGLGDAVAVHQLRQVDLVGAAQDRLGIVHHHQALARAAAAEAVSVVVDRGGLADEQGVVLGDVAVVALVEEIHREAQVLRRLLELLEGAGVGRRLLLVLVDQDGEVVAGRVALAARAAAAGEVLARGLVEELMVRRRHLAHGYGVERVDAPLVAAPDELGLQQRRREQVEQGPRQPLVADVGAVAEIDVEHVLAGAEARQALLDQLLDLVVEHRGAFRQLEVLHRGDVGQDLVAARTGQQGDVVAGGLVAEGAAQVVDAHAAQAGEGVLRQVVPGGDHVHAGNVHRPVAVLIDNDDATHMQRQPQAADLRPSTASRGTPPTRCREAWVREGVTLRTLPHPPFRTPCRVRKGGPSADAHGGVREGRAVLRRG